MPTVEQFSRQANSTMNHLQKFRNINQEQRQNLSKVYTWFNSIKETHTPKIKPVRPQKLIHQSNLTRWVFKVGSVLKSFWFDVQIPYLIVFRDVLETENKIPLWIHHDGIKPRIDN